MILVSLGLFLTGCRLGQQPISAVPVNVSSAQPKAEIPLRYQRYSLPHSTVHLLVISAEGRFQVVPALSPGVDTVANLAEAQQAIAAINGGFFDPNNQKTTSTVILQGRLVADPRQNQQLTGNPALTPYLPRIFNRSEFRRYRCGSTFRYAIARRAIAAPDGCQLLEALGGGPQLLPDMTATAEGFWDATTGRDPIGMTQPNARTAVGLRPNGDVLWVMAAQIPGMAESGLSLEELAAFLRSQGAITALNLDGGTSTAFYYQGKTSYGKVDQQGTSIGRPVKSVLLVLPAP